MSLDHDTISCMTMHFRFDLILGLWHCSNPLGVWFWLVGSEIRCLPHGWTMMTQVPEPNDTNDIIVAGRRILTAMRRANLITTGAW